MCSIGAGPRVGARRAKCREGASIPSRESRLRNPILRPAPATLSSIEVVRRDGQLCVVATRKVRPGERVLFLDGMLSRIPSRYSVQIDADVHVEVPEDEEVDAERVIHRYPWRSLNHACAPSARIAGRDLLAIGALRAGDEVTFDYETTEWDMASPFRCVCSACGGRTIRGFRWLSREEREKRRPHLAAHLLARLHAPIG